MTPSLDFKFKVLSLASLALIAGTVGCSRSQKSDETRNSAVDLASASSPVVTPPGFAHVPDIQTRPNVQFPRHHALSPPLRELLRRAPKPPPIPPIPPIPPVPPRDPLPSEIPIVNPQPDPVVQSYAPAAGVSPYTFQILGGVNGSPSYTGSVPPDPNVAVGHKQIIQAVNPWQLVIFDKTGGDTIGPFSFSTFFSQYSGSICNPNYANTLYPYYSDPIVLYDKLAQRWFFAAIALRYNNDGTLNDSEECIAVSTGDDAHASTYNLYDYNFNQDTNDFPKFGVWSDASGSNSGYYATYNMFPADNTCEYGRQCVYQRSVMLQGGSQPAKVCFDDPNKGVVNGACVDAVSRTNVLPSDLDGTTPTPSGSPNFYLRLENQYSGSNLNLYKFHVDWTNIANSTFTSSPVKIAVAPYTTCGASCSTHIDYNVPQPGTAILLSTLYDRLQYRLAYRVVNGHEAMVVSHSVAIQQSNNNWTRGVRWYEIRDPNTTPSVFQQRTWAPDANNYRWMSSVAMDGAGNIAVGYSISNGSSTGTYPGIRFAGRLVNDSANQLRGEITIADGSGSLVPTNTQAWGSRFGDYTAMAVDPTDDLTFTYTAEYVTNETPDYSYSSGHVRTVVATFDASTFASSCSAGQNLCGAQCVSVLSDVNNCGSCGHLCPTNSTCTKGWCVCTAPGFTYCNGACVSLSSDPSNCGRCGYACPSVANGSALCSGGCCTASCPSPPAGSAAQQAGSSSWAVDYGPYNP